MTEQEIDRLTLRILSMLASGATADEVARRCNVSRTTAWRRVEELRCAWGMENATQVVVHAVRSRLI